MITCQFLIRILPAFGIWHGFRLAEKSLYQASLIIEEICNQQLINFDLILLFLQFRYAAGLKLLVSHPTLISII
jgi:hypothetical protein